MASESGTPPVVPDGGPSGPAPSEGAAPVRRSLFRRRVLPCLLLFVLLILLAGAGAVWWLRTPGGQDWLRQEADAEPQGDFDGKHRAVHPMAAAFFQTAPDCRGISIFIAVLRVL